MDIITTNPSATMSSREIAELTGKQHSHVRRDIKKMLDDLDYAPDGLVHTWIDPQNGQSYEEFRLDRRLTDCLLTGYSAKARIKVIDRWHELESKQAPALPQTFSEALQLAADQAKKLEEQAPKVEFHDKIVNDDQTFSFRDAAKKIQQRPNKFTQWLRDSGYVCINNLAKQQYISQGLFATHSGISGSDHHFTQCRVTSKGLSYFTRKLLAIKL